MPWDKWEKERRGNRKRSKSKGKHFTTGMRTLRTELIRASYNKLVFVVSPPSRQCSQVLSCSSGREKTSAHSPVERLQVYSVLGDNDNSCENVALIALTLIGFSQARDYRFLGQQVF